MISINDTVFLTAGLLSGACLIMAIAKLREGFDESESETAFYKFTSSILGGLLLVLGMTLSAAPFAISQWQWFPEFVTAANEKDLLLFLGAFISVNLITYGWRRLFDVVKPAYPKRGQLSRTMH